MFCIECGKLNPEGAKFCAFCGVKLYIGEPSQPAPEHDAPASGQNDPAHADSPARETSAKPAAQDDVSVRPAQETSAKIAIQTDIPARPVQAEQPSYARQRKYKTLQPLSENPAQPEREYRPPTVDPAPQTSFSGGGLAPADEEPAGFEPSEQPDAGREDAYADVQEGPVEPPFGAEEPRWEQKIVDEDWWGDGAEEDDPSDAVESKEPVEKKKFVFPWQRSKEENIVLTADGTEEMPARKPVVPRRRRDTHIPERIVKTADPVRNDGDMDEEQEDIFFVRPKKPRRAQEDDTLDDAYVNGRVRTILFGLAFALCLVAAVWLFATNSGQMFLAGFNLSSDAQAYRDLGDSARANNQIKRAAEAYYKALSLDPDDYATALLVGRTQQQIGEYDTAANAYYLCTQLQPAEPEPYKALVQLYEIQNETEKADYFRELGLINAGVIIE